MIWIAIRRNEKKVAFLGLKDSREETLRQNIIFNASFYNAPHLLIFHVTVYRKDVTI